MNITKKHADKVIAALEAMASGLEWFRDMYPKEVNEDDHVMIAEKDEALSIMRGLAEDAEPVASDSLGQPDNLEVIIDAFIEDYEMVGETEDGRDACHTPTDGERALIKDAICGLLADTDWDNAWGDLIRYQAQQRTGERVPMTWQPIETAPKDGTQVMLTNGISVAHGNWLHAEPFIREIRDLEGRYIDQDESDGYDGWIDFIGGMMPEPTLWMPLPTPPESKG